MKPNKLLVFGLILPSIAYASDFTGFLSLVSLLFVVFPISLVQLVFNVFSWPKFADRKIALMYVFLGSIAPILAIVLNVFEFAMAGSYDGHGRLWYLDGFLIALSLNVSALLLAWLPMAAHRLKAMEK